MASTSLSPAASILKAFEGSFDITEEEAFAGLDDLRSCIRSVASHDADTRQSAGVVEVSLH